MPTFHYKARNSSGKLIQGIMGAESENAVAAKLEQMSYLPIEINETTEGRRSGSIFNRFKRVKFYELNTFTRLFHTLQRAGLPILSSLEALKEQSQNNILKDVIEQIIRDIEAGSNLSEAFSRHPQVFSPLYVHMIKSGEVSGRLTEILERLAILGEHEYETRRRISAALRYPIIVVIGMIIAFSIVITAVIPRFAKLYSKYSTDLPIPTLILIWINTALTKYWWLLLIIIIATVYFVRRFVRTEKGRLLWDRLQFKIPIFGELILKMTLSRFARVTGTMLQSGIPVIQIFEHVTESTQNMVIKKTFEKVKKSVSQGKGIHVPMKESQVFPAIVLQMVAAGEETGQLDTLMLRVSDYYDDQIDFTVKNIVSLIEPILISVIGVGILLMALGVFMPSWNLMSIMKR